MKALRVLTWRQLRSTARSCDRRVPEKDLAREERERIVRSAQDRFEYALRLSLNSVAQSQEDRHKQGY
jgi:hypothetical protein